jgi:ribokinase
VSGDPAAVRAARAAKVLVATARSLADLSEARVELDALVRSRNDQGETYKPGDLDTPPRIEVATVGHLGGSYTVEGGAPSHFHAAEVLGPVQDTYGAGDSFAAGLTYGLAEGLAVEDAIALAARTGAAALTRRGAHGL